MAITCSASCTEPDLALLTSEGEFFLLISMCVPAGGITFTVVNTFSPKMCFAW